MCEKRRESANGVSTTNAIAGRMCESVRAEWDAKSRSSWTICGGPEGDGNPNATRRAATTATAIKVHAQNPTRSNSGAGVSEIDSEIVFSRLVFKSFARLVDNK